MPPQTFVVIVVVVVVVVVVVATPSNTPLFFNIAYFGSIYKAFTDLLTIAHDNVALWYLIVSRCNQQPITIDCRRR